MSLEPAPPPLRLLNISQAAALAQVSRRTIYYWLKAGKLTYRRTAGGAVRIDATTLFTTSRPLAPPRA